MNYTNLLTRQIKRYLPDSIITSNIHTFLEAINNSYEHYERDHALGKLSLDISTREMRELNAELSDKETRLLAILNAASDGILVVDEAGEIKLCNPVAAHYLGAISNEKIVGQNCAHFPVKFEKKEGAQVTNAHKQTSLADLFLKEPLPLYECSLIHSDASELPIELSTSQINTASGNLKILILRDISNRRQNERKIHLRHAITHILLEANDLENSIQSILSLFCTTFSFQAAYFWLDQQEQNGNLSLHAHYPTLRDASLRQAVLEEFCISHPLKAPSTHIVWKSQFFSALHGMTYLSLPIFSSKKIYGTIELYATHYFPEDSEVTHLLYDIGSEIGLFIERHETLERERDLQQQLVRAARQSGMMQVASSVLHNVGNVLNSVNVSSSILQEHFTSSELNSLERMAQLVKEHQNDWAFFITEDPLGLQLPIFIQSLSEWWIKERAFILKETHLLIENVQHIRNIIKVQQSMKETLGIKEKFSLSQLLDDLIEMHMKISKQNQIKIEKEYPIFEEVILDRGRIMQILINLIRNAIEALNEEKSLQKKIILRASIISQLITIEVEDNGGGIDSNNLVKIFSLGFTTKKEGHGYGLHTSSILAREMKGELKVKLLSPERGKKFILTVPNEMENNEF